MADYKDTINLPQTEFPMKGDLARREPEMLKWWEENGIYAQLREVASDLGCSLAEAEDGLRVVQSLDPTGVGARSLSECLALQAIEA